MDIDEIKKKIQFAITAVQGLDDVYRLEAFKIIFSRELDDIMMNTKTGKSIQFIKQSKNELQIHSGSEPQIHSGGESVNIKLLITKLDVTADELENIVSINNDMIDIHYLFEGTDKQNMVYFAECYLIIQFYVFKKEWIKTTEISSAMKKVGIEDKNGNLSKFLQDENKIFVKRGKRKNSEFKLVAPTGRDTALSMLKNLVKPEN